MDALYTFDGDRPRYNLVLAGRAKKNWKSADLILAALYKLVAAQSDAGNQCYLLANDADQANDNLSLCKKLIEQRDPKTLWLKALNPALNDTLVVKQKVIERKDGKGFLEILPAGDVVGSHGKTYLFCGFDEIHGYKTWDILEAMQLDPTRTDALVWITSYASIFHKPGVPLFDLFARGKAGKDRRMFFSWYASDYCTDPTFSNLDAESRANPSRASWEDGGYLEQQKSRLPSHKYRRLHLNLPGLPEGSAFSFEKIDACIERGVVRPPQPNIQYSVFVDMSGGSSDDATLAIAHRDPDDLAVLDLVINQGRPVPFDPVAAVAYFAKTLREYRCAHVVGDKFAGETFISAFQKEGIGYTVSDLSRSELYEAMEPKLNSGQVMLLDHEIMESQFLGLV